MMILPSMLFSACDEEDIKYPEDADDGFDKNEYPHFQVFCAIQLGRAIVWGEHWEHAKIIASIPEDKIREIMIHELREMGIGI